MLQEGLLQLNTIDENMLMYYKINIAKYDSQLNVTIIPTEECNFRCVYCFRITKWVAWMIMWKKRLLSFLIRIFENINQLILNGLWRTITAKDRVIRIAQSVKLQEVKIMFQ